MTPHAPPPQTTKRASLAEDLGEAGAGEDGELLALAHALVEAVKEHDRNVGTIVGVDVEDVKAAFLRIAEIRSSGPGIVVKSSEFTGGIDIGTVDAGQSPKAEGRQKPAGGLPPLP